MVEHTIVYPKPGVTVHLPGSVAGFTHRMGVGVPMRSDHAEFFAGLGHVETEEQRAAQRQAAVDLAKGEAETAAAGSADPVSARRSAAKDAVPAN